MKIAFIGTNGIPNSYGGFESFLESICPKLVQDGHEIFVTCDPIHHSRLEPAYKGANKIYIDIRANGPLSTIHDLVAFFRCLFIANKIVVLGVSAGPFFPIFRVACQVLGKTLIVNIDGVEWRRTKFNLPVRALLWAYDFLAQLSANKIVYDNNALLEFVMSPFRGKSVYAAYPADQVLISAGNSQIKNHCLTICRIEPENNIEMIIEGFLKSKLELYTIVGNWKKSRYGMALKSKFSNNPRLNLLDPVYDQNTLSQIRSSCSIYVHGHSVGGTNPSLIEMIGYKCYLVCFDCKFNQDSVGGDASYFADSSELSIELDRLKDKALLVQRKIPDRFTSEYIANLYASI